MLNLASVRNKSAHVAAGALTGWLARRHPTAAKILAFVFLAYQGIEVWRKLKSNPESTDEAYPEIAQYGYGFVVGLAASAADDYVDDHSAWRWRCYRYRVWARYIRKAIRAKKSASHKVIGNA